MSPNPAAEPAAGLSEEDARLARQSSEAIAAFAHGEEPLHLTLTRVDGERAEMTVPGRALHMVARVLGELGRGSPSTLIHAHPELTTHQAAALLRVSRPYVIKLLDTGQIPCRRVGRHRRVRYDDVAAYLLREQQARSAVLDEMAEEAQRLGLYE